MPLIRFAIESCEAMETAIEAGMPILLMAVVQGRAEVLAGFILCHISGPTCRGIFAT